MIDHLCVCVCVTVDSDLHQYFPARTHCALHYPLAECVCQHFRCHIKVMCLIISSATGLPSSHSDVTVCLEMFW